MYEQPKLKDSSCKVKNTFLEFSTQEENEALAARRRRTRSDQIDKRHSPLVMAKSPTASPLLQPVDETMQAVPIDDVNFELLEEAECMEPGLPSRARSHSTEFTANTTAGMSREEPAYVVPTTPSPFLHSAFPPSIVPSFGAFGYSMDMGLPPAFGDFDGQYLQGSPFLPDGYDNSFGYMQFGWAMPGLEQQVPDGTMDTQMDSQMAFFQQQLQQIELETEEQLKSASPKVQREREQHQNPQKQQSQLLQQQQNNQQQQHHHNHNNHQQQQQQQSQHQPHPQTLSQQTPQSQQQQRDHRQSRQQSQPQQQQLQQQNAPQQQQAQREPRGKQQQHQQHQQWEQSQADGEESWERLAGNGKAGPWGNGVDQFLAERTKKGGKGYGRDEPQEKAARRPNPPGMVTNTAAGRPAGYNGSNAIGGGKAATEAPKAPQSHGAPPVAREPDGDDAEGADGPIGDITTVMLRNIPNKYTREMLINQLSIDFGGEFDFMYLPIDFKNRCNVGYGFLNFRTPEACSRFVASFHNVDVRKCLPGLNSKKVVEVTPARVQGLVENVRRLRNSPVMNQLKDHPEWMPLLFGDNGEEEPFPSPDAPLPPMKPRGRNREATRD